MIVIAGESPAERAPVFWLRLRKAALRNGARIVHARNAEAAREAVRGAPRVALIWDGVDPAVGSAYAQALSGVPELATFITGEQSNARGAEAMGMLPHSGPGYVPVAAGRDTSAMLDAARAGEMAMLAIFGANPVRNGAGAETVARALERVPFVVVSELFMTDTAARATLVLPAKGAFEKYGTTTNLAGDLLPVNASLQAPDFVLSDLEMLSALAEQLGVALPSTGEIESAVIANVAKPPKDFTLGDDRFAASTPLSTGSNVRRASKILSGGGTWLHDPWLARMREEVS